MMEAWLVPMTAGLFGLAVGSFLNVCTLRWPLDESVVAPASRCLNCKEALRWRDNVPVLSWLILRAKCRFCSEPISVQYPLVEATSALIWAGVFAAHGATLEALHEKVDALNCKVDARGARVEPTSLGGVARPLDSLRWISGRL